MKTRLEVFLILIVVGILFYVLKKVLLIFGIRWTNISSSTGERQSLLEMSERNQSKKPKGLNKAFIICLHREHGYLILYSIKAKKGRHGQLSGGGIDEGEDPVQAAARELFEETGIAIDPGRLAFFKDVDRKRFFVLELFDTDSCENSPGFSMCSTGQNFLLKLSHEHVAFSFIKDRVKACEAIQLHSGGDCAAALAEFRPDDYLM